MAVALNAGKVRRGDLFFVDPFKVKVVEDLRGRHRPPTEEDVIAMAESMLEHGQIQPVECRRIDGNKPQLTAGFTRCAAARLIVEGFESSSGVKKIDPDFQLQVKVVECNDEMAFKRNVVENALRNATSPIDDAFNQQKMRDRYGMSDSEIARTYGYSDSSKVTRLHKLLSLEGKEQTMVHSGGMSISAAIELLDLPTEKRTEVVAAAVKDGKVSTEKVRKQVRDHILADAGDATTSNEESNGAPRKSKPRSVREVRTYFQTYRANKEAAKPIRDFAAVFLKFVSGRCSEKLMDTALESLLKSKK